MATAPRHLVARQTKRMQMATTLRRQAARQANRVPMAKALRRPAARQANRAQMANALRRTAVCQVMQALTKSLADQQATHKKTKSKQPKGQLAKPQRKGKRFQLPSPGLAPHVAQGTPSIAAPSGGPLQASKKDPMTKEKRQS